MIRSAAPLAAALFLASLHDPPQARANGRFPGARQVALHPTDGATLLLRTTFGQMLSRDAGATFRWVCEEAIGYGGTQDPAIAITADGSLLNAAYEGTSASHDGGCSFPFAEGLAQRYSVDLTLDGSSPARALVVVARDQTKGLPPQCWESLDDGRRWEPLAPLPQAFFPQNVDVARSRPQRIYITGLSDDGPSRTPLLLRSDDGGASWEPLPLVVNGSNAFLSAVDPLDAERFYVRVEGAVEDELIVSENGGFSYRVLARLAGGMLGFALSPDGSRIAIGGPEAGVLVASREDGVFSKVSAVPVSCLAWGSAGLYACGIEELASGFALGLSKNEGASFVPLLAALGDTCGPSTTCAATTPYAGLCPARWPAISDTLRTVFGKPAACATAAGFGGRGGGAGGAANGGTAGSPAEAEPGVPRAVGGCSLSPGAAPDFLAAALGLIVLCARRKGFAD